MNTGDEIVLKKIIQFDILWETATCDIPDLKEYCKKFIV